MQSNATTHKKTAWSILLLMILVFFIGETVSVKTSAASSVSATTISVASRTTQAVNLKIKKASRVTGYQIYRAIGKNGTYTKVKTTKELAYKDTKVSKNTVYYYKVRTYVKKDSVVSYSAFSKAVKAGMVPGKVTGVSTAGTTAAVKLLWTKISTADSYRIYRSTSKSGSYSYLASAAENSYSDKTAISGKTYYYKIRSYRKSGTAKYFGAYSSVVSGKRKNSQNTDNGSSSDTSNSDYVSQVIALVNKERKKEGISPVKESSALTKAALTRAKEIVTRFEHTRTDGTSCFTVLDEYGISYMACGENIAYGQKTPAQVMEAWMNSAGHRQNIMSTKFGTIGIGYYVVNNTPYWVQLFTN